MDAITTVKNAAELQYWMQVPELVAYRYKEARDVAATVKKIIKHLPSQPGYGYVFWHPDKKSLHAVLGDGDDQSTHNKWSNTLKAISGVNNVSTSSETHPSDQDEWIMVKSAAGGLGFAGAPFQWAGKLTGGASPMTNTIVGSMLTGGLGYGTGWLLEHLFPERYVERGKLRKTLGLMGAGLGAVPGVWQGFKARGQSRNAGQPMGLGQAFTTPTEKVPLDPVTHNAMDVDAFTGGPLGARHDRNTGRIVTSADLTALREALPQLPEPSERFVAACEGLIKEAIGFGGVDPTSNAGGVGLRSVPMDAFNRAIWNDVRMGMSAAKNPYGTKSPYGDNKQQMHTPPQLGAATSGLVSGLSSMYGGRSVLSPRHFINGLATAGVDLATARVVGGTLGALGGLTPEAQRKVQDAGLWGGLIRGTVGSMLR